MKYEIRYQCRLVIEVEADDADEAIDLADEGLCDMTGADFREHFDFDSVTEIAEPKEIENE
jgi:hypothetical protein